MAKTNDETAPATSDAYTGMLSISLLALIGGCVLLFLDFNQYPDRNPPKLPERPPSIKIDAPVAAPSLPVSPTPMPMPTAPVPPPPDPE